MAFAAAVYEVARHEAVQHLRTKRLLVIGGLMLLSLVLMTIVLPVTLFGLDQMDPSEGFGDDVPLENFAFFIFLNFPLVGGYLFIQILSIVMTADAVSSEWQRKTLFLVLSKPVPRAAFVLGKYLGAVLPLTAVFLVLFLADYALLQSVYPGAPSAVAVGRFFGAIGFILLGALAFAAMGLFFSAVTRSSTGSLVWSLSVGLLLFPIVGAIGDFTLAGAEGVEDPTDAVYDWSHYVTPNHVLSKAGDVLAGQDIGVQFSLIPTNPPAVTWLSAASGGLITVLFVAGAVLTVQRRDFE